MGDLKSFQARFVALRQTIVSDGMTHKVPFSSKDLLTLSERIEKEGTSFAEVTLPLLGKALDHGLVTGQFNCPANFKRYRNTCLPMLCHSLFREVFGPDGILLLNPNTITVFFLRQFLLLDGKLINEPTPVQKETAVLGFVNRQSALRKVKIDVSNPVLIRAQALIGSVLSGLDLTDIVPGHGPGAVAEKLDRFERWDFTSWPSKAERYYPYGVYGTHSLWSSLARGKGIMLRKISETRCCLVPKDFKGPRLISAEGTVNQYLQQGQMKSIMSYVERHPILSRSIQLRDQTHNQTMAQMACQRNLVTLDLSNASDTVSVPLVWFLFAKVPLLRRQLIATRSDYMRYASRLIKITAFAPMGSATCFPIETLVFWALTMASLMLVRHQSTHQAKKSSSSWRRYVGELAGEIAVFGDDIIVPEDAFLPLSGTLTSVGCEINKSKTCYQTSFKESCGTEWINDIDVTIIRNRRYHYEASNKFGNYPALCELQRKFFLRGLHCTADLVAQWAREIYPCATISIGSLPQFFSISERREAFGGVAGIGLTERESNLQRFSGLSPIINIDDKRLSYFARSKLASDSFPFLLGWFSELDSSLPTRWNRDLQRMEVRIPSEYYLQRDWMSDGYPRLLARLLSDKTNRIALPDRKVKMAWSFFPFFSRLSPKLD